MSDVFELFVNYFNYTTFEKK